MVLSSKQRKFLESLANDLEPIVRLGKFGVTPTLVQTVDEVLTAHELMKIKILENAKIEKEAAAEEIIQGTGASLIKIIGRVIILYRPSPDKKERIEFPDAKSEKKTEVSESSEKKSPDSKSSKPRKKSFSAGKNTRGKPVRKSTTRRSKR
jgi:RNA-binding protein